VLAAFALALALTVAHPTSSVARPLEVVPPAKGMYHAAFPGFCPTEDCASPAKIRAFDALAGKRIAWAYFSDNWFHGISFPTAKVEAIWSVDHTVPFVRIMPRTDWRPGCADKQYSLARIVAGDFDPQLRAYASAAAATGIPIMMEFGTEANGNWFPWSGPCNGGPEAFKAAWRHVVGLFREEGAWNVTWVLHLDASEPRTIAAYYPGAQWVDWVGLSAYGAQVPGDPWTSFESVFAPAYRALARAAPGKPIALLEFGAITERGHSKAAWITDAFRALTSGRYPRVEAESYWNSNWTNGGGVGPSLMRIDTSPAVAAAYRTAVASPDFVGTATLAGSPP
jgi:hypothetical protein